MERKAALTLRPTMEVHLESPEGRLSYGGRNETNLNESMLTAWKHDHGGSGQNPRKTDCTQPASLGVLGKLASGVVRVHHTLGESG